ncbi:MAG: cobyric acid synthase [Candidatus Omnitrophica bacterium]|nr:cobyric acid synthase [Candidatus Omnitrophota bacterium]
MPAKPKAKALMFQGTSSHAGKSVMAAAFCRLLARQGFRVAPFKGMNMSNNASVTRDGGEIATAQAAQAKACGIEPSVKMNPVLLKTMSDQSSQVILLGKPIGTVRAGDLARLRPTLMEAIESSLEQLMEEYQFLVIEGAGSPAEVNLKSTDLANMAVARRAGAPVILVADIERGGLFAHLIGTLELLEPEERAHVKGFIINKFRGDPALLEPGVDWLEKRTGRPVVGVIPFLEGLRVPEEDSCAERLQGRGRAPWGLTPPVLRVQVVRYPTISNFTDFDPLDQEPNVELQYLTEPPPNGPMPDLLILPGSKSTMADLSWLKGRGLDRYIARCVENGVELLGICGGFQMLGQMIYDPRHVESEEGSMPGLGWLPTSTLFLPEKITAQVSGIHIDSGEPVRGYEIHAGRIQGIRRGKPVFRLTDRGGAAIDEWDGCLLSEKRIWGTYLHGLFDAAGFRRHFLNRLRPSQNLTVPGTAVPGTRGSGTGTADTYEVLADGVRRHLRLERLKEVAEWIPRL